MIMSVFRKDLELILTMIFYYRQVLTKRC